MYLISHPHVIIFHIKAILAATRIFTLLDRKPLIDSTAGSGLTLSTVTGEAEFREVSFKYPSRKSFVVLDNLDLRFEETIIIRFYFIVSASNRARVLLSSALLDVENQLFYNLFRGSMISALGFCPLRIMTSML